MFVVYMVLDTSVTEIKILTHSMNAGGMPRLRNAYMYISYETDKLIYKLFCTCKDISQMRSVDDKERLLCSLLSA